MSDKLNISTISIDVVDFDKSGNLDKAVAAIRSLPAGTDIAVLPEMFSTGFGDSPQQAGRLAETVDGEMMTAIRNVARECNLAVAGSFLAREGDKLYNKAFLSEPDGKCTYYDKHHLFCISKEAQYLESGRKQIPVARYRGWNIALSVCYEARFPVWLRNAGLKYDLLLIPANWPDRRGYAWRQLLIARAIENQAYVCGANRSGCDIYGCYDDLSFVFDYAGQPIAKADTNPLVLHATLDKTALEHYRDRFPVWRDTDAFTID